MKKLIIPLLISGLLGGCASFPSGADKAFGKDSPQIDAQAELGNAWAFTPPVTYVKSSSGLTLRRTGGLPSALASKPVILSFKAGEAISLDDLVQALRLQGLNIVSRLTTTVIPDLLLPKFKGSAGELMELLGQLHDITYEHRNGVIFFTETARYSVALPQHEDLMKRVATTLEAMGATSIRAEIQAGMMYFNAKPTNLEAVTEYLEAVSKNSAMVTLQVAVLTVGHNKDRNIGFDWAQLLATAGSSAMRAAGAAGAAGAGGVVGAAVGGAIAAVSGVAGAAGAVNGAVGAVNGAVGAVNGAVGAVNGAVGATGLLPSVTGSLVSVAEGSLGYKFASGSFNLTTALKALSTYGTARTEQNVMLGTLSGMPVKITSGNEIPYVKTVGSSVAAGGAVAGSIQTEIIKSGLDLEVTPYFDAADASLVTKVKVSMSALVGFRELSAGPSAGKISQPEIQKLTFENVGRLNAGETVIMGGITYDQQTDNYQTLPGLENMEAGSKSQKNNRQAIYIVVRPTVVIFTADADKLNANIKNGVQSKPKLELENSLTTPVLELDSAADAKAEVAVLRAQKRAAQ